MLGLVLGLYIGVSGLGSVYRESGLGSGDTKGSGLRSINGGLVWGL